MPTIIPKESITQQHDEHWTKQPAQGFAGVSFDDISSVYGPYFPYEAHSGAHGSLVGMPAPSITRGRHYTAEL